MIIPNRKEAAEKSHKAHIDKLKPNARNVFMGQADSVDTEEIMSLNTPEVMAKIRKEHEASKH